MNSLTDFGCFSSSQSPKFKHSYFLAFLDKHLFRDSPCSFPEAVAPLLSTCNDRQSQAINHALSFHLTLIEGAPGTGKSFVLGRLCLCHLLLFRKKSKILLSSTNNVAVDVLLSSFLNQLDELSSNFPELKATSVVRIYPDNLETAPDAVMSRFGLFQRSLDASPSLKAEYEAFSNHPKDSKSIKSFSLQHVKSSAVGRSFGKYHSMYILHERPSKSSIIQIRFFVVHRRRSWSVHDSRGIITNVDYSS